VTVSSLKPTILLTGATGLLGRFVLARLLQDRQDVVVLVRGAPHESAHQKVEAALTAFEKLCWLPRPRVVIGDLSNNRLSLTDDDLHYLASRPLQIIHCAASIRFQRDEATDEPYRTNVQGTRHLLQLCEQWQVTAFHYVSTAYVGSRSPLASLPERLTTTDDMGGNDYENSKIMAEQLVADSTHLGHKTIHRPSIIVGDSQSGFTSTFHGFYAPLHIGYQLAAQFGFAPEAGNWFRQQLDMRADDSKNLVPVNWVAEVIVRTVQSEAATPGENGEARVFHWTNPHPVPCGSLQDAIVAAIGQEFSARQPHTPSHSQSAVSSADFRQLMQVYEAYFNCDPTFDNSRARATCPQLPCPVVDSELLKKLADFAIAHNFGWPKVKLSVVPHSALRTALRELPPTVEPHKFCFELRLLGPGALELLRFTRVAGRWHALDGKEGALTNHNGATPPASLTIPMDTLADCFNGKTSLALAFEQGCCIMEGQLPEDWLALIEHWMEDIRTRIVHA